MSISQATPPLLLAGPILRQCTATSVVIWLATSQPLAGTVTLSHHHPSKQLITLSFDEVQQYQVGEHAWVSLIELTGEFATDQIYCYHINTQYGSLVELYPSLLAEDETQLTFYLSGRADHILHGSCRNPHDPCRDALLTVSQSLVKTAPQDRPDLIMMSGDQIYADHVAGAMLAAIHTVIDKLGLYNEALPEALVADADALYDHPLCYFHRDQILPRFDPNGTVLNTRQPKPIFTSTDNENHLITFGEFTAMYLLVWSKVLWQQYDLINVHQHHKHGAYQQLSKVHQDEWLSERTILTEFIDGLPALQSMMAHIPIYMIFDDHDVTDDWNLTDGWEYASQTHPFSRRIIGNALLSYWFFQGWGNAPHAFDDTFHHYVTRYCQSPDNTQQNALIDHVHEFKQWHYITDTSPSMVVLDTRTRRWRSESNVNRPSGLMDWEALMELQQAIENKDKVIIVSAAPMFGVKFIEALQRVMTWLGKPLMVDAENWMAHPGCANALMNIFTHSRTPSNYVILSGDVHYSFAYDIKLRSRNSSPNIFQITCSGFKNQFPEPLLTLCDYADAILYSPHSPLNKLTKRKRLEIRKRHPSGKTFRHLYNHTAVGVLKLADSGKPNYVGIVTSEGVHIEYPATPASKSESR
ncbi:MAG: alkaline phosphatase family protein [Vibrio sp.]